MHTVVTKPVRPSEVVLGRMLGFTIVGTGLLLVMALVSYGFVVLGLTHTHAVEDLRSVGQAAGGQPRVRVGKTGQERGHRHQVLIDASGQGRTDVARSHWHEVSIAGSGEDVAYESGAPEGMLLAKVPIYGKLRFRDPEGIDKREGINVGDEWTYRGYIQGGSPAALIWRFEDIGEKMFPEGLPIEMTIGVFRTHKGLIERGVLGSVSVRNPRNGLMVELEVFESKEFATKRLTIPRKITKFVASPMVVPRREETR
ncbi:unnamed protein product, partial [marine sediment metagenome]